MIIHPNIHKSLYDARGEVFGVWMGLDGGVGGFNRFAVTEAVPAGFQAEGRTLN
jgi:hypothetical protein